VSKEVAIERIKRREQDPSWYLKGIDDYYQIHLDFDITQKAFDYVFDNEQDDPNFLVKLLAQSIEACLKQGGVDTLSLSPPDA